MGVGHSANFGEGFVEADVRRQIGGGSEHALDDVAEEVGDDEVLGFQLP